MAEPETEKKKTSSSMILDTSLLSDSVSKLQLSPSSDKTLVKPDWSLLPEELLQLISTHLEKTSCFVGSIHARSVCRSWRSTCPFPSRLLSLQSYSFPLPHSKDFCTLEKIPLFLFRVKTPPMSPSEYFLGGIAREDHHTELLTSPIQSSVKVNLPGSDPTVMNMLDCQILPLGHRYRIIDRDPKDMNLAVAFLPLNEEGRGGGFVVLLNYYYSEVLFVLRSSNMEWTRFKRFVNSSCHHLFTFKGKFYAIFLNGDIFVINPYNLMEAVPLMPPRDLNSRKYLVPSGDDEELFLVEIIISTHGVCRVRRLDEEAGEWVVVSDLGDRVLFIGQLGNVSCSGKELPDGCGLTGNSILFTNQPGHVNCVYKYGVETGNAEDDHSFWRLSRENRVLFRNRSPPVVALRVESPKPNWSLLPGKLLQLISTHLEKKSCCFLADAIHVRSVCSSWRSTFPFPSSLLPKSYGLPSDNDYPIRYSCTIEKFPLFLFRLKTQTPHSPSEYFLGGIALEDLRFPPPLQCSVKANFPEYNPILINVLDCQILPLGHHYRMISSYPGNITRLVALLPLNNEEEDEFVVLLNYARLLVYKSSEMRWTEVKRISTSSCKDIITFRGKFYVHCDRDIFVVDPYNTIGVTSLMLPQDINSWNYLVPSSDDEELFLVEKNIPTCRVSKLDEETGEWIVVSDLGDRVLIIGWLGNVAFSVKEFPDDCGLSENSILFTDGYDSNVTFAYKYDDLGFWRLSKEDRVFFRNKSPPVLAFRVDRVRNKCFL